MTTNQLGIAISQHLPTPAPRRPNPSVSSPPGAKTPPNRGSSAPNKPNDWPSRPQNADSPRKTNPNGAAILSKAQRSRMDLPNIGAQCTPISPLKSQISNPQPCAAALSSTAPNKPNFRSVHFVISGSCEMRYAKSGRQARAQNKPKQSQLANPVRRYAPRWQDRPIPRIMPRLSTRRRMDNG